MKTFRLNQDGSVSVFLISIVAAMFFFSAVLIDFARIQAAKRQTDLAVQAGVRSVMASFDSELHEKYGLFGNKEDQDLFQEIMKSNLTDTAGSGAFQLIDPRMTDGSQSLTYTADLGNQTIFQQQVLEDMKYKAPVEMTLELFDKFKSLAKIMKSASTSVKSSQSMTSQFNDREKSIEQLWILRKSQLALNAKLGNLIDKNGGAFDLTDSNSNMNQINDIENIASHYDYIERRYKEIQAWEQEKAMLEANSDAQSIDKVTNLNTQIRDTLDTVNAYLKQAQQVMLEVGKTNDEMIQSVLKAEEKLTDAKRYNEQMKETLTKAEQETGAANYNKVGDAPDAKGNISNKDDFKDVQESLDQIAQDLKKMILPDAYFTELEQHLSEEKSKLAILKGVVSELSSSLLSEYNTALTPTATSTVKSFANEIYRDYNEVSGQIVDHTDRKNYPADVERQQAKVDYDTAKNSDEMKKREEQGKVSLKEVLGILDAIKLVNSEASNYVELDGYYKKYLSQQTTDENKGMTENMDLEGSGGDAMSIMDKLFEGLSNFFESMRNEFYVNEYAFQRFHQFDASSWKFWNKQPVDLGELSSGIAPFVSVKGSEIEYITYGLPSPGANIGAAYGELFLVRLALRTLEGLTDTNIKALGHPLLVLIAAIAYGVVKALVDMKDFFQGKPVSIIGIGALDNIKLVYKDYLRLFLLIHTAETKKLARLQALIQYNTQKDLSQYQTYVEGTAEFSVRLWFLPGIMKALNQTVQLNGHVQNNRYYYRSGQQAMSY